MLTRYARWHVVGRARTNRHGQVTPHVAARCRADIQTARAFLDHLTTHGHDLDDCPQACIDTWLTNQRS